MKRILTAIAAVFIAAVPAQATTFSSLTLIYLASGVADSGNSSTVHVATTVPCTNISGQNATVRWIFYAESGVVAGTFTGPVPNGVTVTATTAAGTTVFREARVLSASDIFQGMVRVYSTQSGVFCSSMVASSTAAEPQGIDLNMVRFNAHPGTVE